MPRSLLTPEQRRVRDNAAKAANLRRYYAEVKEFTRRYKSFVGCVGCGCRDWRCLDIDHMDGKSKPMRQCRTIAAVKAEIRRHKCKVRCANCHRIRTFEEQLGRHLHVSK